MRQNPAVLISIRRCKTYTRLSVSGAAFIAAITSFSLSYKPIPEKMCTNTDNKLNI
jgi:hypothetical protein